MSQAYYRKWRPQGWDEVVGQEHIIRTLRNAVGQGKIAHAYLFSGPRGTGKTTTARIIAKAANCLAEDHALSPCNECSNCKAINENRFLDLIEIDAASNTSVDDVRELREKINFLPSFGRYKVYIIDEVHMLSNAAFNALLKTLEEPPTHAIFILATTEVHRIPATILSRCQRHEFRHIPLNIIQAQLMQIADNEKIHVEPAALTAIARQATGSMRDAVSLLDQLSSTGADVSLELTQQVLGTASGPNVYLLVEMVQKQDMGGCIAIINQALNSGSDPRQFARQVVDFLRAVLMAKMEKSELIEATHEEIDRLKDIAKQYSLSRLVDSIRVFDQAAQHFNFGWQPGLPLELAAVRAIGAETEDKSKSHLNSDMTNLPAIKNKDFPDNKSDRDKKSSNQIIHPGNSPLKEIQTDHPSQIKADVSETDKKPNSEKSETSIEVIKEQWKEIRAVAKGISPETAALLNSCKSMEIRNGKLVIGFSSAMLRDKMEAGQNLANAQAAILRVVGMDIPIGCRVAGSDESEIMDRVTEDNEGMISAAIRLGGKITKEE